MISDGFQCRYCHDTYSEEAFLFKFPVCVHCLDENTYAEYIIRRWLEDRFDDDKVKVQKWMDRLLDFRVQLAMAEATVT